MTTRRYALFGLLDDGVALAVRSAQCCLSRVTGNDLALRFPVHITLRGRFQASPMAMSQKCDELDLGAFGQGRLLFSDLTFRPPDLLWLEVTRESPGYADLVRWHCELTRDLKTVLIEDETSLAHTGEGYRPHITIGWGASKELLARSDEIPKLISTAFITAIVVVEYPATWPASGTVVPIYQLRLTK